MSATVRLSRYSQFNIPAGWDICHVVPARPREKFKTKHGMHEELAPSSGAFLPASSCV
jgi:hypothetical protein